MNSRCASAWVIAGSSASKRPVWRNSCATCRVIAIAISEIWLAVLARATPSASSCATLGWPARTLMLSGANDVSNRIHHGIRAVAVTRFDVGRDRHARGAHDPSGCGDDLGPGCMLAVGIAERPGRTTARRGDRVETRIGKDAGAHCIPGVGQQTAASARGAYCGRPRS